MDTLSLDWSSFWDLATPQHAAKELLALHGAEASVAAACCALTAYCDEREADYRFWKAVFYELRNAENARPDRAAAGSLS